MASSDFTSMILRYHEALREGTLAADFDNLGYTPTKDGVVFFVEPKDVDRVAVALADPLGPEGWNVSTDRSTGGDDDDDDDEQHFLGAFYDSEGIGDNMLALAELADELAELVERAGVGEVDGLCDEGDEQAIFTYGPDADALLAVMEPLLRKFPVRPARIELRYGAPDDPKAREREIRL